MPLIALPTTAGIGIEVTFGAVVTAADHNKQAVYTLKILPNVTLLDAELTLKLPPYITVATGLDAMVHCIEGYTSRTKKKLISNAVGLKRVQMPAFKPLPRAYISPEVW